MEQAIGPEAVASIDIVGGKLVASVKYAGADAAASLNVEFDAKPVVVKLAQKLKDAIPGGVDDLIIDAAIAAVLK